jgi:hypothetical protein
MAPSNWSPARPLKANNPASRREIHPYETLRRIPVRRPDGANRLRQSHPEAKAAIFAGPADATKQPLKTVPVALGTVAENLPVAGDGQTVVVTALIDVPVSGIHTLHAGFGESSHNVVLLDGREVYRKEAGAAPVITKVPLEAGKRYPVRISYFKGGSAAFWLEQVDIEGRGDLTMLTNQEGRFTYLLDGPELGFGHVMGTFHDEPVLLIKTAMGNRSLDFDFRPPSSGKTG